MSVQIVKQGIMDTLQDKGRYGFQHIGIPPCGYLDYLSAQLSNVIVGNPIDAPIFELHFPASSFIFKEDQTICISGANFVPVLNDKSVAMNTAIHVCKNDTLHFMQPLLGKTCYLAIKGNIDSSSWLNSKSDFISQIKTNDQFNIITWDADNKKTSTLADEKLESSIIDNIQYTEYYGSNKGHYDWHYDAHPWPYGDDTAFPGKLRKLSATPPTFTLMPSREAETTIPSCFLPVSVQVI